ncbi:hypothetical protein FACS1894199_17590 [Bacteroidia bacterium]|nr:hypothetical protein FACS1894199_17590 [Bacteroidia bacterium]
MKKTIVFVGLLCSLQIMAQPRWLDDEAREADYPNNVYITGFASGNMRSGETKSAAVSRIKKESQGLLVEGIRVEVNTQTSSSDKSVKKKGTGIEASEEINSIFESATKTAAKADITGVKIETYEDVANKLIYAFATVKKAELTAYYRNQLSLSLEKVEGALGSAEELAKKGVKISARKQCEDAVQYIATIAYAQDLLSALDPQADLQQRRSERLRNELVQTLTDLENSIYVYIKCKEVVDGEEVEYIVDLLPGLLTNNDCGCNFTTDENNADYVLNVSAYIARCNDAGGGAVFCWANATVSLYNAHTQKTLKPKIDEVKGAWTGKNYTKAGEEAFKDLAKKIAEKVIPMMKN